MFQKGHGYLKKDEHQWTDKENKWFITNYSSCPLERLKKQFPNRTIRAICQHGRKLNLSRLTNESHFPKGIQSNPNPAGTQKSREKAAKKHKQLWKTKKYRNKQNKIRKKTTWTPEVANKIKQKTIKLWKNPEYQEKQKIAKKLRPNKLETTFQAYLNYLDNDFVYMGDYSFWVNGKNPDFVNFVDAKIIELFGDYWHKGENPQKLINHYQEDGYDCLVLWESEIKNGKFQNKLKKFLEE